MVDLPKQQERFCLEYVHNGLNGKQAYKVAYPKCKTDNAAEAGASRLLRNVKVQEYIKELQSNFKKSKVMSIEERRQWLSDVVTEDVKEKCYKQVRDDDTGEMKEVVIERVSSVKDKQRSLEILNKMDGVGVERTKVEIEGTIELEVGDKEKLARKYIEEILNKK